MKSRVKGEAGMGDGDPAGMLTVEVRRTGWIPGIFCRYSQQDLLTGWM